VAVAGLAIKQDRATAADYLTSVLEASSTLIVRNPAAFSGTNSHVNFTAYLKVFLPHTWILMAVLYILILITSGVILKVKMKKDFPWDLPLRALTLIPGLFQELSHKDRLCSSVRIASVTTGAFFTVLSAYYGGALT